MPNGEYDRYSQIMHAEATRARSIQSAARGDAPLHHILDVQHAPTEGEHKGVGVFTNEDIEMGKLVIVGRPLEYTKERTPMTFQYDWETHVILDNPAERVNHSCDPNLGITGNTDGGYNLVARTDIPKGSELTWAYFTTEMDIMGFQRCLCGAENCIHRMVGWRNLAEDRKIEFLKQGLVAPYILQWELARRGHQ